jgi:hypothetical protein
MATAIAAAHHCGDHRTQQLHSSTIITTRSCCLLLHTALLLLHFVVLLLIMSFNSQHLSQLPPCVMHLYVHGPRTGHGIVDEGERSLVIATHLHNTSFSSQHPLSQLRSTALHLAASVRAATALQLLAGSAGSWDSGRVRLPRSPQR